MRCGADLEVAGQEAPCVFLKYVIDTGVYRKPDGPGRTYTLSFKFMTKWLAPWVYQLTVKFGFDCCTG